MVSLNTQAELSAAVRDVAQAGNALRVAGVEVQSQLLEGMAHQLETAQNEILEANTLDLEASLEMAVPDRVLEWLKLTPERLHTATKILRRLALLGDPRHLSSLPPSRISPGLLGHSQVIPIGVVAFIYEAFPELAIIMAGLCARTGNSLILKGGNEASQTNQMILQSLQRALDNLELSPNTVLSLAEDQGDATRSWLLQNPGVNLAIPYGRPSLVKQVIRQAAVPVLPTAMGNCYLYWSASGALDTVIHMVLDSHRGEPDAVNALEKVLIHTGCGNSAIAQLCHALWDNGFEVLGDDDLISDIPELKPIAAEQWSQPFLTKTVALGRVDSNATAAHWINTHSSGHANALATESYTEANQFTHRVNSAVVYLNTSPRFVRNPAYAANIALGMTAQPGHYPGFVGLSALLTTQHILHRIETG